MAWDDEKRKTAVKLYTDANPTAETSIEIAKDIGETLGESVNGVKQVLIKQGVYVAKSGATASTSAAKKSSTTTSTRVSKEDAHAQLVARIEGLDKEVDQDIISKLTGKAAIYIAGLLSPL